MLNTSPLQKAACGFHINKQATELKSSNTLPDYKGYFDKKEVPWKNLVFTHRDQKTKDNSLKNIFKNQIT